MSLYNALFGVNPLSNMLMQIAGVNTGQYPVPRFRDCWIEEETGHIVVYTRTGGGNRQCFCGDYLEGEELQEFHRTGAHRPNCYSAMNRQLMQHPLYVRDYDDDFDGTYAYFVFRVPEAAQGLVSLLQKMGSTAPAQVGERFQELIEKLQGGADDEETRNALVVGRQILGQIREFLFKPQPDEGEEA